MKRNRGGGRRTLITLGFIEESVCEDRFSVVTIVREGASVKLLRGCGTCYGREPRETGTAARNVTSTLGVGLHSAPFLLKTVPEPLTNGLGNEEGRRECPENAQRIMI